MEQECATAGRLCSNLEQLGVAAHTPKVEDVDHARILIDGVDDPKLGVAPNPKEIGSVGRSGQGKVGPGQRCLAKGNSDRLVKPLDLLDRELLAVGPEVDCELIDLALSNARNPDAVRHTGLALALSIDPDQALLERFRLEIDAVAG